MTASEHNKPIVPEFNSQIDVEMDGEDYINIDISAKTQLGRWLADFTYSSFVHPFYGPFRSIVGYSYWLSTGKKVDALRSLTGRQARSEGIRHPVVRYPHYIQDVKVGHWLKVKLRKEIREMLGLSTLPLESFYLFGQMNMPVASRNRVLVISTLTEIRDCIQRGETPEFFEQAMIRYQGEVTEGRAETTDETVEPPGPPA
jgi:hypothetical protein